MKITKNNIEKVTIALVTDDGGYKYLMYAPRWSVKPGDIVVSNGEIFTVVKTEDYYDHDFDRFDMFVTVLTGEGIEIEPINGTITKFEYEAEDESNTSN